jgi:hypothetical protein
VRSFSGTCWIEWFSATRYTALLPDDPDRTARPQLGENLATFRIAGHTPGMRERDSNRSAVAAVLQLGILFRLQFKVLK